MTFYHPGAYDHSVLYTNAQLTEGRSARDQPKQPPAKKTLHLKRICLPPLLVVVKLFQNRWSCTPWHTGIAFVPEYTCLKTHATILHGELASLVTHHSDTRDICYGLHAVKHFSLHHCKGTAILKSRQQGLTTMMWRRVLSAEHQTVRKSQLVQFICRCCYYLSCLCKVLQSILWSLSCPATSVVHPIPISGMAIHSSALITTIDALLLTGIYPMNLSGTSGYGALHRHRFRNGLSVLHALDLEL